MVSVSRNKSIWTSYCVQSLSDFSGCGNGSEYGQEIWMQPMWKKLLWHRLSQPSYKVEAHIAHKKFWMYRLWFVLQIEIVPCETPKKETSWEWWLVFLFEAEGRLLINENIYDKTELYITR